MAKKTNKISSKKKLKKKLKNTIKKAGASNENNSRKRNVAILASIGGPYEANSVITPAQQIFSRDLLGMKISKYGVFIGMIFSVDEDKKNNYIKKLKDQIFKSGDFAEILRILSKLEKGFGLQDGEIYLRDIIHGFLSDISKNMLDWFFRQQGMIYDMILSSIYYQKTGNELYDVERLTDTEINELYKFALHTDIFKRFLETNYENKVVGYIKKFYPNEIEKHIGQLTFIYTRS